MNLNFGFNPVDARFFFSEFFSLQDKPCPFSFQQLEILS